MNALETSLSALPFAVLAVPSLVLLTQIAFALPARRRVDDVVTVDSGHEATLADDALDASLPPIAVLMPAHDEASGIAASIASLMPQLRAQDRLLVVADNCSDDTAAIAERAGAEVTERTDAGHRGKGYALDHGVRELAARPPGIVVVVDADCSVAAGSLRTLAATCAATGRPAQALYLMRALPEAGLKSRIAEFAWCVRNLVRPLGSSRLGVPCQLTGSGMALPWPTIEGARLAHADLVEDMRLGLDLAMAGSPPVFCPAALVTSTFPTALSAQATQRARWEHGHLSTIARDAPAMLWHSLTRADPRLLAMLLDLCVPPLASLVLAELVALLAGAGLLLAGAGSLPLTFAMAAFAATGTAVLLAWRGFGRAIVTLTDLCSTPAYIVAKVPLYLRWIGRRQAGWIRTGRGDGGGGGGG